MAEAIKKKSNLKKKKEANVLIRAVRHVAPPRHRNISVFLITRHAGTHHVAASVSHSIQRDFMVHHRADIKGHLYKRAPHTYCRAPRCTNRLGLLKKKSVLFAPLSTCLIRFACETPRSLWSCRASRAFAVQRLTAGNFSPRSRAVAASVVWLQSTPIIY